VLVSDHQHCHIPITSSRSVDFMVGESTSRRSSPKKEGSTHSSFYWVYQYLTARLWKLETTHRRLYPETAHKACASSVKVASLPTPETPHRPIMITIYASLFTLHAFLQS